MTGILAIILWTLVVAIVVLAVRSRRPRPVMLKHRPSFFEAGECVCGNGWPCLDTTPEQRQKILAYINETEDR